MSLTQLLLLLRARWRQALLAFALVVGLTLAVSLSLPKQYRAMAAVVIDFKPDPLSGMIYNASIPAVVGTQIDTLRSERVVQRVIANLKLTESPQIRDQWLKETSGVGSIEQWLGERLRKGLEVVPPKDSGVITVAYTNPDPNFAAAMANAFVRAFLDTTLELRVDPARGYSAFFAERAKAARENLEALQNKYSTFQNASGIIMASDERLDIENTRLIELSSQLVAVQALSAESSRRQTQAAGAGGDKMPEVLNNSVVSSLKAELARSEAQLQQLNQRLGENHPQVLEARASVGELRLKVDAETRKVTGGVGLTSTINRQRESDVLAALEAQRAKVLRMKAARDEGLVMQRDMESAQRLYEQVMARQFQTGLESQSTQTSSVYLLTSASPPLLPTSPRVLLNTLIAVFAGLILAVITALLLELFDRRLRSADDMALGLGVPMIGVIPDTVRRPFGRTLGAPLLQQQVLGQLSATSSKGS